MKTAFSFMQILSFVSNLTDVSQKEVVILSVPAVLWKMKMSAEII